MSAIGDYVHLTYAGYAVEGAGARKSPYLVTAGRVFTARERQFNNWINKQKHNKMQALQDQLNKDLAILNKFQVENKGSKQYPEIDEIQQALIEDIAEELPIKYFQMDLFAAAANGLLSSAGFGSGKALQKFKKKGTSATQYESAVVAQVNTQLNDLLSSFLQEVQMVLTENGAPEEKVLAQVARSKGKTETFIRNLSNQTHGIDPGNKRTLNKITNLFQNLSTILLTEEGEPNVQILGLIYGLIQGISGGLKQSSTYKGDIGEAVTAAAARRIPGIVGENIASIAVVGQDRSQRGFVKSNFSKELQNNLQSLSESNTIEDHGDYVLTSTGTAQDKVDVSITFKDDKPMGISVKNYSAKSLNKGFHNASANLLTLLQNENDDDFINHYLNLTAIKQLAFDKNREAYVDLIKRIVVAKLITGYNTQTINEDGINKMDEANIFAVYNSQGLNSGGAIVSLYSMRDVLQGVFQKGRYSIINVPGFLYETNQWQPHYETRITNVMKQLAIRVSYTMKPDEYLKS